MLERLPDHNSQCHYDVTLAQPPVRSGRFRKLYCKHCHTLLGRFERPASLVYVDPIEALWAEAMERDD